jgi:NADH:ubiquinone oxidoreductase subunit E
MKSFREHLTESHTGSGDAITFKHLLPKKVYHMINRLLHKDKYKAAIKLKHSIQRKYPDYSEAKVLRLVSDFTHIKLKELKAILNRKTRHD